MTNDPDSDSARRLAAARWHAELQEPEVTSDTWDAFRAWEAADPANAAAYHEIERVMGLLDKSSLASVPRRPSAFRRPVLALGAAALAAAMLVTFLVTALASPAGLPVPEQHQTGIGEREEIRLADGSRIHLNTDTQLTLIYSDTSRLVSLVQGQALFDVAPDPRPFEVRAGHTGTIAHGTVFDIWVRPDAVRIALVEGGVSVQAGSEAPVTLSPGQQAVAPPGIAPTVSEINPDTIGQWRTGQIHFDNVPLDEAIAEMNRYSATQIVLDDAELAGERVSGVFVAGEPEAFADALALYLSVGVQTKAGRITLSDPAPGSTPD